MQVNLNRETLAVCKSVYVRKCTYFRILDFEPSYYVKSSLHFAIIFLFLKIV